MVWSRKDINEFFYRLHYNRDEVLAYNGTTVDSFPREGHYDQDTHTFYVIDRKKKSIHNGKSDIGVIESNNHVTYPGSLLLANSRLVDNYPDILAINRAPLKYTIDLPGLIDESSFTIVPTYGNYESALNEVLDLWYNKYQENHDINVRFQSDYTMAYSKEQLRVKFGMEFKESDVEANIDFSAVNNEEKMIMIHRFQQIFYTVSVETQNEPADYFGPEVSPDELARKCNDDNPPVIVDNVSYGRVIYLKIETSSTDQEAKFILETKITKFDTQVSGEVDYTKALKNLSMEVYVMGGGSQHLDLINAKSIEEVNAVILHLRKFGPDNPGYPMCYATQFLKDNARAVINSTTEYTETTSTQFKKGVIKLKHRGWFVAQFWASWDEVRYEDGKEITENVKWSGNWENRSAPYDFSIDLGGNCRNIEVYARICTGWPFKWWTVVMDHKGIPLIDERTFSIWGTTFSPQTSVSPKL